MAKVVAKTLPGFMELLPQYQIKFNEMIDIIRKNYEKAGFLPLDTPIIESSDVLLAKAGGETEKQIYRFEKGDNDLALRFDLTVPLAKYVAIHNNDLAFPFRRYQIGKVYRGEKPQKGRFREFYQCDIDIIGDEKLDIKNEAEIPSVIYNIFKELGFENFTIHLNNRKILNGLFNDLGLSKSSVDIMRIIDKLDKIGIEKVSTELEKINVNKDSIEKIRKFIQIQGDTDSKINQLEALEIEDESFKEGIEELKEVIKYIRLFNVPEQNFMVDLTIARGLDYYTGTVYETTLDDYKQLGSVCSGGRYDNLSGYYTDKKLPGVGMAIGLTRLFDKFIDLNIIEFNKKSITDVLVIPATEEDVDYSIKLIETLRKSDINAQVYLENKKLKAKFKYADKLKIPYAIVIGEEERETSLLTLKNMEIGEQEKVNIEKAIEKIKGGRR